MSKQLQQQQRQGYDRVLVDASHRVILDACREAIRSANGRARRDILTWPPPGYGAFQDRLRDEPEGWRQWALTPSSGQETPVVVVAWWTDRLYRQHVRIVGWREPFSANVAGRPCALWAGDSLVGVCPVALIYPGRIYRRGHSFSWDEFLCPGCGMAGTADKLGWMGRACAICHDRQQEQGDDGTLPIESFGALPRSRQGEMVGSLAFSADGRHLAVASASGTGVQLWQRDTGEWGWHSRVTGPVSASPVESLFAWRGADRTLMLIEPGRKKPRKQLQLNGIAFGCAWSPDGQSLAVLGLSRPTVYRLEGDAVVPLESVSGSWLEWPLVYSPDGRRLAARDEAGQVLVWDVASGRISHSVDPGGASWVVASLAFAPDSRSLTLLVWQEAKPWLLFWDLQSQRMMHRTEIPISLEQPPLAHGRLAYIPRSDGRLLLSLGEQVIAWDVNRHGEIARIQPGASPLTALAVSADSGLLATGDARGEVRIWPVDVLSEC